ncbi:hypothetical protein CC86DRAFT_28655 [Ophiobolus disseminans]|uniref:F-box domain-containing protein n=1 Tax=Ophiobolus disseminans TaxID=1469910 RepID=A0A6A6ZZT4_9PLEO|nr:hypothetical protein CC86DRAFT_28655 [Ophiobolus disseminans]
MPTESHVSTGVGPPTSCVSMPPETLPPELWHLIIALLNDHCFAWHVLRRVSPYLRLVTEDVFARCFLRTCSLRFAGEPAQNLLPSDWQATAHDHHNLYRHLRQYTENAGVLQLPTFPFQPCAFVPSSTKAKVVFKLCEPASDPEFNSAHTFQLPSNARLADIFFKPGAEADSNRTRLIDEAHFVRFNNQLKSIRTPSLMIDVPAREITLDWRQLCQDFLRDEYKCRSNSLGSWSMRLLSE